MVRQGAGRGALSPGVLDHLPDRRLSSRSSACCWAIRWASCWRPRRRGWATLGFIFVLLPLWTSVLVRTYAWMVLLGRNGVFNRWLIGCRHHRRSAAAAAQPHRRADRHGARAAALHGAADLRRGEAARSRRSSPRREGLGASAWRIFWRIYLPLTLQRHLRRLRAGLRAVARLLHHAGAAGRRTRDHDRHPDRAAGARSSLNWQFAVGALGRAAGGDPRWSTGLAPQKAMRAEHEP